MQSKKVVKRSPRKSKGIIKESQEFKFLVSGLACASFCKGRDVRDGIREMVCKNCHELYHREQKLQNSLINARKIILHFSFTLQKLSC